MADTKVSTSEIKELLNYMQKVTYFEKITFLQYNSMDSMIWGLLLLGGGILSQYFISEGLYIPAMLPWGIAVGSGIIISYFIENSFKFTISKKEEKERSKLENYALIVCILIMILSMTIYSILKIIILVFPTLSIIALITLLITERKLYLENSEILNRNILFIIPILLLTSAIFSILLAVIEYKLVLYHGLIFGIFFGGSFMLDAILKNKAINNYIDNIDLVEE